MYENVNSKCVSTMGSVAIFNFGNNSLSSRIGDFKSPISIGLAAVA